MNAPPPEPVALAFLPAGVVVILVAPRLGPVIERLGTRAGILAGLVCCTAGFALFLRTTPSMPYAEFLIPTMLLFGIGFSFAFASLNAQATAGVANEDRSLASGLVNTSLQVGTIVVLAVASAVLTASGTPAHDQFLPQTKNAVDVIVGVLAGASLLTVAFLGHERRQTTPTDTIILSAED